MAKHAVSAAKDLPPGSRKIVNVHDHSIGVFNVKGEYFALRNSCPHQGGPLCRGKVTGRMVSTEPFKIEYKRDGEIVKCPWHGWEFDILTGESVFNPHKVKVKTYDVSVEDAPEENEPSVDTYPVTVEGGIVFVHV